EIAATGSMVVISPRDRLPADPKDPDRTGSNIASTALLAAAGVPVAVTCPGGMFGGTGVGTGGILGQDLNTPHVDAAFAVRGGLDNRKALRTLTLDAARILGVDARIGSLEAGKDADILILDGDPLHYATFVETAIVNGKVVYEKAKEPLFRHISR
ncbi:MAG: amidohydrolase family protein, partial [Planctomycetes bacterium]|nr:amidohydrolase family protein [Planctomycetota bacterium]